MTTDQKIIKNKVGLLELARQLGDVSRACSIRIRPTCNRGLSGLRCLRQMSWGIVAAVVLCVSQSVPAWGWVSSQKSGNAAHDYRQAFEEIARLPDADAALPGPNEPLPPSDKSEQIVSRLGPALKCLREATAKQECDWENDLYRKGAAAAFPHLAKSRDLVGRAILRARYYWQSGKRDQAIEDVRAVVVLARHVGDEGRTGLVVLTERYRIEQTVVDVLCQWSTDAESARSLDGLCRLALQPEGNLPKIGLLLERETLLPWTRRLVTASNLTTEEQKWRDQFFGQLLAARGAPWILQKLDETKVHYTEVGDLLDLPIDQFAPKFRQYLRKLDGAGNPFSQMAIIECPGIPSAYLQSRNLRAQWTILQAASSVFHRGLGAVKKTADPYGDGPLKYEASADGFTIRSALVIDGKPVVLRFTRVARSQQSSGESRRR
ncbi:MAG: hypothetical protein ACYSW0_18745 [Planctomycetota bacterium]